MPASSLKFIKEWIEYQPLADRVRLPKGLRGIYALYRYKPRSREYDVVYIGMSGAANRAHIRTRLKSHAKSKSALWTHFSVFVVWDNIRDEEIRELEGLFRHIYSMDSRANRLNRQRRFKKLKNVPKIKMHAAK